MPTEGSWDGEAQEGEGGGGGGQNEPARERTGVSGGLIKLIKISTMVK